MEPRIAGRRFEQFVICQIAAAIHYSRADLELYYWRTNHGAEVDLLICEGNRIKWALEIKSSQHIVMETLSGLRSFMDDNPDVPAYILGKDQKTRKLKNNTTIMNWDDFIIEMLK
jgi:uncharacterized protein